MDSQKKKALAAKGWRVGSATEFLGLSPEESRFIELKLALSGSLRVERLRQDVTQAELAKLLGSSQSRIAKMEAADPTVTVDLLLKALLVLGVTKKQLAKIIA
ncbi:MAG: helix-turn-helix transcriptional regulator [Candidatus Latescibacteria bacterium]|nr:helix-turn-helix transcriptional regulator [Candidatus Latescibacterota bacterium]